MGRWYGPDCRTGLLAAAVVLAHAASVRAHALGVECKPAGGRVEVEAYFDDDTPAADAGVTVRDAAGSAVASGKTDAKGCWSFPAPAAGTYRVTADAGDGHATTVRLTVAGGAAASAGPRREEFTRTPWLKLGIGLGAITLLAAGYLASRRGGS